MKQQQRKQLIALTADWPSSIQFDVPMASYSTLRAGGKAAGFIDIYCLSELQELVGCLHEQQLIFRVIGRGSNILVTDKGFPGVMIRLKGAFEQIAFKKSFDAENDQKFYLVQAGGGCSLGKLLSWCIMQGLSGLECMAGIPGSVGGSVRMNAGAVGGEISDCLHSLDCVDDYGHVMQVLRSELQLSYRKAEFKPRGTSLNFLHSGNSLLVVSAYFRLRSGIKEQVRSRCAAFLAQRKERQPTGVASAGSFFKNPPHDAAGRLIEAAGLKGRCCGEVLVSPKHANFIVNTGKGTATDILTLMEQVQEAVFQKFAIRLEPEVEII
ncbi:MAG: UDP-N-acetylmuramate dehydrogenase [Candidatus Electrothrix sp. AU1_5]|nr:UDP-N-acetylmuramate dehydrogenase [Candidatus Electrothrix gigas]